MERAQKSKFVVAKPFDPTDALHVVQKDFQVFHLMYVHLAQQRDVPVEIEMWKRGEQKILAEDELFDRPTLVRRVVDQNVGEHRDTRQRVWHEFRVFRFEVEKLTLVPHESKAESAEPCSVFFEAAGRSEVGKIRLIIRPEMVSSFEPVKDFLQARWRCHAEISFTGEASSAPSTVR